MNAARSLLVLALLVTPSACGGGGTTTTTRDTGSDEDTADTSSSQDAGDVVEPDVADVSPDAEEDTDASQDADTSDGPDAADTAEQPDTGEPTDTTADADDTHEGDTGVADAGDDTGSPTCDATSCPTGCCVDGACRVDATAACGTGGGLCVDCTLDGRADLCLEGRCVCAAEGAICPVGVPCTATGCDVCEPTCAGRCPGADDGCGSTCPADTCANGCCSAGVCVLAGGQHDGLCGGAGETCRDCALEARTCEPAALACVSPRPRDARFVAQAVPQRMEPGASVPVTVTMQNIGTSSWTAAGGYRLGAQNPQDTGRWGTGRLELSPDVSVGRGERHTFYATLTAPSTPGIYPFHWRMLQESVVWFGAFTAALPIQVGQPTEVPCTAADALRGVATDASAVIQGCLDAAPVGSRVTLAPGRYQIDHAIRVTRTMTLGTRGLALPDPPCTLEGHVCAELRASPAFSDTGGILKVLADGSHVDHLVIHGNREARLSTPSADQCRGHSNGYGYNMRVACSSCTVSNSVTTQALCGTGLELAGVLSNNIVWRNTVAYNGVHHLEGLWADGVTSHDSGDSTFASNTFIDNTDIDLIFGGCPGCFIQDNTITHTVRVEGETYAGLMLHAWPDGATSGDFTGADTSRNVVDCGPERACGFGLYLGSDAWYIADTFGGTVHHNAVLNGQHGVLIDDITNTVVYDNPVFGSGTSTVASCGTRATGDYGIGTRSAGNDFSQDTLGTVYPPMNFDGCIPNWWR